MMTTAGAYRMVLVDFDLWKDESACETFMAVVQRAIEVELAP